ncbi:MAG: phage major capsid protein [Acidobacteria bacterium]|nr:phage major capsid protein [Acidobacteriota bacterium]
MAYDSKLQRGAAETDALIPEEVSREIHQAAVEKSVVLQRLTRVPMSTSTQRMPVLDTLPEAYWLTGTTLNDRDTGLKQTTTQKWANKYLYAEELAVIVPIPEALLDDLKYGRVDVWGQIKPRIAESIGKKLDSAVLFGTDAPSTWPNSIVEGAVAASHSVTIGTSTIDLVDDFDAAVALIEADGFLFNGTVARIQARSALRRLRDANNQFLFDSGGPANTGAADSGGRQASFRDEPISFSRSALTGFATGATGYSMIVGDWGEAIIGVRQDITFKLFDTGVIQDAAGNIIHNLMQQDMVALRAVARYAFQVPNPVTLSNTTEATRYPFAVLVQRAGAGGE